MKQDWTGKPCPKCNGGGMDNDGNSCVACAGTGDEYGDVPDTLTPTQRLTCLLTFLDDVIKKDEERTHGLNARVLKVAIAALQDTVDHADSIAANKAWDKMVEISKLYPDKILKRHL